MKIRIFPTFYITDGQVSTHDIRNTDHMIEKVPLSLQYVETYVIGSYSGELSVGLPFMRSSPGVTYEIKPNYSEPKPSMITCSEGVQLLSQIRLIEISDSSSKPLDDQNHNLLQQALVSKMAGRDPHDKEAQQLRQDLEELMNRYSSKYPKNMEMIKKIEKLILIASRSLQDASTTDKIDGFLKSI